MDNQLMLVYGTIKISWFAVFTSAACLIGMVLACILRKAQKKMVSDIFITVVFSVPLGLFFGRLIYAIFPPGDGFLSFAEFADVNIGGYGLYGVIFGGILAAFIACKAFHAEGVGSLLDCLAVGGALAITIGRFATCFTGAETGYDVKFRVFTVYDSEQDIYNLAVYQLDGIYEAIIFVICFCFFIFCLNNKKSRGTDGKTAMLMLALHGTNQVVMDSMRADALMLSFNRFIKISQIIGILCCVAVLVYLIVIDTKKTGFKKTHSATIMLIIIAIILGVFGEYRVGSANYIRNHLIMFAGMILLDFLTLSYTVKSVKPQSVTDDNTASVKKAEIIQTPVFNKATAAVPPASQNAFSNRNASYSRPPLPRAPSRCEIDYEELKHELDQLNHQ